MRKDVRVHSGMYSICPEFFKSASNIFYAISELCKGNR